MIRSYIVSYSSVNVWHNKGSKRIYSSVPKKRGVLIVGWVGGKVSANLMNGGFQISGEGVNWEINI